jgi:DNA-binding PadR family transcriptional regulator
VLDVAILGLLGEHDRHGYEIRRQLRDELGLVANVSFGSLYPALARLERLGAVEVVVELDATLLAGPATGSLSGERAAARGLRTVTRGLRSRKVYRLTGRGRELFYELLAEPPSPDDPRSFSLRLALARHLPPGARLELLERRRDELVHRLGELEATSRGSSLDGYARTVVDHAAQGVRLDIEWLGDLVAAERVAPEPFAEIAP